MPAHWLPLGRAAQEVAAARGMTIEEGREALLRDLADGRRDSEGIRWHDPSRPRGSQPRPPPDYEPISEAFWQLGIEARDGDPQMRDDYFDFKKNSVWGGWGSVSYTHVRVAPVGEVSPWRLPISAMMESTVDQPAPRNQGGRPPAYDWDQFWIQIIAVISSGKDLPKREELTEQMREFVAGWVKVPDDSTVRKKIARLYAHLIRRARR
jgi:hypothetical protein